MTKTKLYQMLNYDPLKFVKLRYRPIFVITGGILIHLTLGTLYSVGNMIPYMASYMRAKGVDDSVTYTKFGWFTAIMICFQGAFLWIGGLIDKKFGPRFASIIGGTVVSVGVLLTSLSIKHAFWSCLLTYCAIFGSGIGLAYGSPLACCLRWLPDHRGLASGFIVAGYGCGALVFNQIQTAFINPKNYSPDKSYPNSDEKYFSQPDLIERVPNAFLLLGCIYCLMQIIGCLLIVNPPEPEESNIIAQNNDAKNSEIEQSKPRNDDQDQVARKTSVGSQSDQVREVPPKEVLKSGCFYVLFVTFFLTGQDVIFMTSFYKTFGQSFIKDDQFLATVGSVSSLCNAAGRIFWGWVADRTSYQVAMSCITIILTALDLTLYSTSKVGKAMYLVWVCANFGTFGGLFTQFPYATAKCFGAKYFGVNYGLLFGSNIPCALINAGLSTLLLKLIGYSGMYFLLAACTFAAFLLTTLIARTKLGRFPVDDKDRYCRI